MKRNYRYTETDREALAEAAENDFMLQKEIDEETRRTMMQDCATVGKCLVDEGADEELVQAFRDFYQGLKSEPNPIEFSISFKGKKLGVESLILSLEKRGIKAATR